MKARKLIAASFLFVLILFGALRFEHVMLSHHEAQTLCHPHHQKHFHNLPNDCPICHFTLATCKASTPSGLQRNLLIQSVAPFVYVDTYPGIPCLHELKLRGPPEFSC